MTQKVLVIMSIMKIMRFNINKKGLVGILELNSILVKIIKFVMNGYHKILH
jgi:hypothetical protein